MSSTNVIRSVAPPLFLDAMDYVALVIVIIHFVCIFIIFLFAILQKLDIKNQNTQKYLTMLTVLSLVWQIIMFWAYFCKGHQIVRFIGATSALPLTLMTVVGQMEILKAVSLYHSTRHKVKILQIMAVLLFALALIGRLTVTPYMDSDTPDFWAMFQKVTYMGFMVPCVLYENYHCIYVSYTLFHIAKAYAALGNLHPAIWNSQKAAYMRLFALVGFSLIFSWIGLVLWMISYGSNEFSIFPNLYVIGANTGILHVVFVALFIIQLTKVPLEKHAKAIKARNQTTKLSVTPKVQDYFNTNLNDINNASRDEIIPNEIVPNSPAPNNTEEYKLPDALQDENYEMFSFLETFAFTNTLIPSDKNSQKSLKSLAAK
ncbi:hypothetical protein HDV02_002051 [Globomyces sp. JEL0801]|nr:hypothetical protein HDV02_002051 [Globomyces sp. JEL0801]